MNKKIILASHGSLAEGMLSAIEMIIGKNHTVVAFGLDTYETPEAIDEEVAAIIATRTEQEPVIMLTDIKGGSVYNQLVQRCNQPDIYVLSGMNLSLCLEAQLSLTNLATLATDLEDIVKNSQMGIEVFHQQKIASKKTKEEEELW